jgi:recombination protein RecT
MGRDLAQRAAARRSDQGGELEESRSLADQIKRMQPEYEAAMPKGREATQLVRDAITCLRTIKNLDKCTPESVLGALMTCAQLDLRPGVKGLDHAWPLPYWDNRAKCYKAQLIIGYKGYVELGYRSGQLASVTSRIVYTEDEFEIIYRGDRDELIHKPDPDGLREDIRCFYSTARLVNGGYSVTDPMSLAAMEAHRERYAPRDRNGKITGPWVDHLPGMGQKTMVRINFKMLPKSPDLAIAMEADEGVRVDLAPTANAAEVTERIHRVVAALVEPDEPSMDTETAESGNPVQTTPEDWPGAAQPGDAS